jgi:hypothetical protein
MEFRYTLPEYNSSTGVRRDFEGDFRIAAVIDDSGIIVLKANRDGLISLAKQMIALAQPDVPYGSHFHYDAGTSLEDDSVDLIITKLIK